MRPATTGPYLLDLLLDRSRVPSFKEFPFNLPAVRHLSSFAFHPKVTFLVGLVVDGGAPHAVINADRRRNVATRQAGPADALRRANLHGRAKRGSCGGQSIGRYSHARLRWAGDFCAPA